MNVEYPPLKCDATLAERGLDMASAAQIFEGATLTVEDHRRGYGETCQITIGFMDNRMVVMAWTQRDTAHRFISLRKANERERKTYADRF